MSDPIHPPQLYEVVKLVKQYIWTQTGKEPSFQDVADCLAGAAGTLAGLQPLHEGRAAQLYDQAKLLSQNFMASKRTTH